MKKNLLVFLSIFSYAVRTYEEQTIENIALPTYFFDELECDGKEESLLACKANDFKDHDCGRQEFAGVKCSGMKLCAFF